MTSRALVVLAAFALSVPSVRGQDADMELSIERSRLSGVVVGGKALFAGGAVQSSAEPTDRVDIYDPLTESWSVTSLSQARGQMGAAVVGDKAFFGGGRVSPGITSAVVDVHDAATGLWSVEALSQPREHLAAAATEDVVVFAGGWTSASEPSDVVDIYRVSTDEWSVEALPGGPRQLPVAVAVGDLVFIAGGQGPGLAMSDAVDVLNTATGEWSQYTLSQPRAKLAATACGDRVFFAGGASVDSTAVPATDIVDVFDVSDGSWLVLALEVGRWELSAVSVGGRAYFLGGAKRLSNESDLVDVFDAQTLEHWTTTMSSARGELAAVAIDGSILAAGGVDDGASSGVSDAVDVFHVSPMAGYGHQLSVATGGSQTLDVRAGSAHAFEPFVLLGGASGITPSTVDPLTGLAVPLVLDAYTTALLATGGGGVVTPFLGVLDGDGRATAKVAIPAGAAAGLVGVELHHVCLTVKLVPRFELSLVSDPIRLELMP